MKITIECNSELFIKILKRIICLVFRDRLFNVKYPKRYKATSHFYITTLYHVRKIYLQFSMRFDCKIRPNKKNHFYKM